MGSHRSLFPLVKVRYPCHATGLRWLCVLVSVVLGLLIGELAQFSLVLGQLLTARSAAAALMIVVAAPPTLAALAAVACGLRVRQAAGLGLLSSTAFSATLLVTLWTNPFIAWLGLPMSACGTLALIVLGAGAIASGLAALVTMVTRTFIYRVVSQDGTLCWHCTYPIRVPNPLNCSECGQAHTSAQPQPFLNRLALWCARHERLCIIVAGSIYLVLCTGIARLQVLRYQFGQHVVGDPALVGWAMSYGTNTAWPRVSGGIYYQRELPNNPNCMLCFSMGVEGFLARPRIGVSLVQLAVVPGLTTRQAVRSINWSLDAEQSRQVLTEGVPSAFLDTVLSHVSQLMTGEDGDPNVTIDVDQLVPPDAQWLPVLLKDVKS
jgi:hypothetical protein